jgi:hypothetical protein
MFLNKWNAWLLSLIFSITFEIASWTKSLWLFYLLFLPLTLFTLLAFLQTSDTIAMSLVKCDSKNAVLLHTIGIILAISKPCALYYIIIADCLITVIRLLKPNVTCFTPRDLDIIFSVSASATGGTLASKCSSHHVLCWCFLQHNIFIQLLTYIVKPTSLKLNESPALCLVHSRV